ncbi:adenosylhomocysteinase-like [Prosopis cineraria]|uniref:adenosylhomocysteinase-like n=1 Tax=Prosopis cineraria TaxID=364024 RepID=UPI0024104634|nr:adenosylhomocysteinase-like [Prosopis cineraria]XP_054822660.1 adenosylhomocysteinase-like [Prosopis cineraria]XP_054822661.1 adenosylhomocysteinase-like [Prosopis cineraria]XP_054822662.1 adenosylhomocysteinase-like [Prosopis cineraria]XP_054822663.1 adenosylhomocysteinase-like [Prosopis cineraria]
MIAADSDSFFLSAVLASKESSSGGHNDLTTTVTDPEVPTLNSYRYAFPHVLFEAVNGVVAGKKFMVWAYGDGGKRCTHALMQAGADVAVYEDGHVHWRPEGPVLKLEEALPKIDVFIYTARDDKDNKIMFDHVRNMKKLVVLVNIEGSDKGFDMEGVLSCPGVVGRETMTSGIDILDFPRNERRVIVVGQGNPMKMAWVPQHSIFDSLFDAEAFLSFAGFTAGSTREQAAVSSTGGVDTTLAPAADNDDEREWLLVPWLII